MKKTIAEKTVTSSVAVSEEANLRFEPERKAVDAETAEKMAAVYSSFEDCGRSDRHFKYLEFHGVKLKGEDLFSIEAHYSKFVDCEFTGINFGRMEAMFAVFENCVFKNCNLSDADFSFSKLENVSFYNCNLNCIELDFTSGKITVEGSVMKEVTAQNARKLSLTLSSVNACGLVANFAVLTLDVVQSNLRSCKFNDSILVGNIRDTDLTNGDMSRSDLSLLSLADSSSGDLETEDSAEIETAIRTAIAKIIEED